MLIDLGFLYLLSLGSLNSLLTSLGKVRSGDDWETALLDELLAELDVSALEPDDKWDLETDLLDGVDDTLSDHVAPDDTTEDVDEDALDLWVAADDEEALSNGGLAGTTTKVEEVSWFTTGKLDNIAGGHSETGTVNEASDITIELDVVKAVLLSPKFHWVDLGKVSVGEDLFLPVVGGVVEVELAVDSDDPAVDGLGEWVDFDLGSIGADEELPELLHFLNTAPEGLARKAELGAELHGDWLGDALDTIEDLLEDGLWALGGDLFDLDTTLGGGDDDWGLGSTVEEDSEVELLLDLDWVREHDGLAVGALSTGLLGDEVLADHLGSDFLSLSSGLDEVNTALEAVLLPVALATATSVNLSLDDDGWETDLVESGLSLLWSESNLVDSGGNVELGADFLGLIFEDVERT